MHDKCSDHAINWSILGGFENSAVIMVTKYGLFSNVMCSSIFHLSDQREIVPTHK